MFVYVWLRFSFRVLTWHDYSPCAELRSPIPVKHSNPSKQVSHGNRDNKKAPIPCLSTVAHAVIAVLHAYSVACQPILLLIICAVLSISIMRVNRGRGGVLMTYMAVSPGQGISNRREGGGGR